MPAKPQPRGKQRTLSGQPIDKLWLVRALDQVGISQRALAGRVGLDPSALNRSLNGKREWKFEEMTAVASNLEVTVAELIRAIGGARYKDWANLEADLAEQVERVVPHVVTLPVATPVVAGEIDIDGKVRMYGRVPDEPFSLRVVGHPLLSGSIYVVDPMSALEGRPWAVVAAADGSFAVRWVQPTLNPREYNLSTVPGFAQIDVQNGVKVVDLMPIISTIWDGRGG